MQQNKELDNEATDEIIRRIQSGESRLTDSLGEIYPAPKGSAGIAAAIISRRDTTNGERVLRDIEEIASDFKKYGEKHNNLCKKIENDIENS